jgi:DNA primase
MAGRIPQTFIDDLLDRVDIVDVIDRRVKLKKTGKNYSARCPFHDEKTPSFSVNPEKQFYYCFGCGAGGNALGFVMEYDNVEFPQAVEQLAQNVGMEVPREPTRGGRPAPQDTNKPLYELMQQAARFYQQALRTHPEKSRAVNYLRERGLTGVIAKDFGVGYAPPGWDNLLKALGEDEQAKKRLLETGMLVKNDAGRIYDRFRDRVVFPIRDQRGRVIGFGGRVLGDDKPKYLNSPETPIFHKGRELYGLYEAKQANRRLDRVVVVEGYMDVIALAQHDITYAVATLGTATSQQHLERIFRLCPQVVFCFDGDEAGRKAALRALEAALPCLQDGRQARFLFLPEGEDPDTLVRARGKVDFEALVDTAPPLEDFLFASQAEGLDLQAMDGRALYSKRVLPFIRQLPEGVFRELMLQSLADRTGIEKSALQRLEAPAPQPAPGPVHNDSEPTPPPPDWDDVPPMAGDADTRPRRREPLPPDQLAPGNLSQTALALLLQKPELARRTDPAELADVEGPDAALLREAIALIRKRPESNTAMLLGHWYGTSEGEMLGRLAGQDRLIPPDGIDREFTDTIRALAHLPRRSSLQAQVDKLKSTDYAQLSSTDKEQLRELLRQKRLLDAERRKS